MRRPIKMRYSPPSLERSAFAREITGGFGETGLWKQDLKGRW
jgi:hypothetical protein